METSIIKTEGVDIVHSIEDLRQLGKIFMNSGLFQDTTTEAQAIVKIMAGREIGMSPFASMAGIDIIRNKVVIKPILLASKMKSSEKYNYQILQQSDEQCIIDFFEKGKNIGKASFTIADAKRQGLAGKDNYQKQPKVMLFWRALALGIRQFCPDLYSAPIYIEDEIEPETTVPAPPADAVVVEPSVPELVAKPQEESPPNPKLTKIQKNNMILAAKEQGKTKDDVIAVLTTVYGHPDNVTLADYDVIMNGIRSGSIFEVPTESPNPAPQDEIPFGGQG